MKAIREVRSIDTIRCWTDRYITVEGKICMISLFGTQTRVNTIRAIILKGETLYLQDLWTWKNASSVKRADKKLKAISRQLSPGVAHCVIYAPDYLDPKEAFAEKIFFGDSVEQVMGKFFFVAQKRYSTPFLPAWTDWLWNQMEHTVNINALGFNEVLGVNFPDEADLESRLFEAGAPLSGGCVEKEDEEVEEPCVSLVEQVVAIADAVADDGILSGNYKRHIDMS
jgi:hypothetical protein